MIDQPIFCLTSDIDWASPFCTDDLIRLVQSLGVTPTLFATHDCPVVKTFLESHPDDVGVHPNFRPGSTHGMDLLAVIDYVFALCPRAKTFRSHAFYDSTDILLEMSKRGVTYDSNLCLYLQPHIVPLRLGVPGITRFPVFWEDDCHWAHTGGMWSFESFADAFTSPGLKIVNVHPFMIAANIPSAEYYTDVKKHLTTLTSDQVNAIRHNGPGARTFLIDLITFVQAQRLSFYTLRELHKMFPTPSFAVST
jgi:hypothetical protein